MNPTYTPANTRAAFQLNWSIALFGQHPIPKPDNWLQTLITATEPDGVRILSAEHRSENVIQFFASTRPGVSPSEIIRSVKGRLQYLIRTSVPKAFRRNYHIQSVGEANSAVLDQYVAVQLQRHFMVDDRVNATLQRQQFHDLSIDLSQLRIGTYGQYLNSLHVCLENADGWNETRETELQKVRNAVVDASRKRSWQLSRIGMLSNHLHVLIGASVTDSPESVVLALMNEIAQMSEGKPILKFSYYVGSFGPYNRGVFRQDGL